MMLQKYLFWLIISSFLRNIENYLVVFGFFLIFAATTKTLVMRFCRIRMVILLVGLLLTTVISAADGDKCFYVYNASNGLADNSAQTIHCTHTGRLVITTMGQINFYDGQKFAFIDPTTENTYPISNYRGHAHLYFDKYYHLWLKTRRNLSCVDLVTERFANCIKDEFENMGMNDQVDDLFADRDDGLWLLTSKGLFSTDNQKYYKVQPKLNLQDVDTYDDKFLLLFYENGQLDGLDLASGDMVFSEKAYDKEKAKRYASTSLIHIIGNMVYQIRNGVMNGSNVGILQRFNIDTQEWDVILETPYYLSNLVDRDSILYIPSAYGYWTYDLVTGQKEHIEQLKMADGHMLLTDINVMEFDLQGGLWVGTEKRGLLYARPHSAPFHALSWTDKRALEYSDMMDKMPTPATTYKKKSVNCVFHDSRGWDWVGTSTGLQLYENMQSANLPRLFTRNDGLLNNVIHCVVEDQDHNIWVGTSYGICCVVIQNDKVRYITRYNQWDGVPNESFVNGRSMLLPNGSVVMQALDHVVEFNPGQMTTTNDQIKFEMNPKLIRLFVNGNDIRTGDRLGGNVILEKALTRTKEINLNYDQNSVSLTFSALNYFRPQQTCYRVRVQGQGMSNKWEVYTAYNSQGMVDNIGLLHLPLASLLPGTYTIEVQASMHPDEWENSTPYEWIVNIHEPWWRTTGMFVLLGLVLMALLLVYVYLYLKNANMRARRNSEEQNIIKRIRSFAERCDVKKGMVLDLLSDEEVSSNMISMTEFTPEFQTAMAAIMPVVLSKKPKSLTMRELSNVAGLKLQDFYSLMTSNIYKSPRPMAMQLMLERASKLLLANKQRDIAEISKECGFVSPNYFIASFFRKYRKTPKEFRS